MIYLLFFIFSIVLSAFGQGGGVVFTPLLILLSWDILSASTTSQFLIIFLSASSAYIFFKAGTINWKLVFFLEMFTIPFSFMSGYFACQIPNKLLIVVLVIILIISGVMILSGYQKRKRKSKNRKGWFLLYSSYKDEKYSVNLIHAFLISFLAGTISGAIGIGGGVIKTPALYLILGVPLPVAIGCSSIMVGFTALAGFSGHIWSKIDFDVIESVKIAFVVVIGANIGPRLSLKLPVDKIKKLYGVLILILSILIFLRFLLTCN